GVDVPEVRVGVLVGTPLGEEEVDRRRAHDLVLEAEDRLDLTLDVPREDRAVELPYVALLGEVGWERRGLDLLLEGVVGRDRRRALDGRHGMAALWSAG
ncbi:hypothetical protein THAOC_30417, partial [Thalassiosira oceanica]